MIVCDDCSWGSMQLVVSQPVHDRAVLYYYIILIIMHAHLDANIVNGVLPNNYQQLSSNPTPLSELLTINVLMQPFTCKIQNYK